MSTSKHYSAAAIFEKRGGVWGVYAVTVPGRAEMKLPGGSSKDWLREDPNQTLDRELLEELKIILCAYFCFHVEKHRSDSGDGVHFKYFHLLLRYEGVLKEGFFTDDQTIKRLKWVPLPDFYFNSFHHKEAFRRALVAMSDQSESFARESRKFRQLLAKE